MKTVSKIAIAFLATVSLSSCMFDINFDQVNGDGNVVTETRNVGDFDQVRGTNGLDVFLTEGTENKVMIEADENLQPIIETEVRDGKLIITTLENIGRSKAKKVHITYTNLTAIEASSGADVEGRSVVKSQSLSLSASSGSDLKVEIFSQDVTAQTSSGADITVSGKAANLYAQASSGSDLNAKNLLVATCEAKASSGADITVHVKERLATEASSGGDINYYGNPATVSKQDNVSGGVHKM
jgi:hypothetical protein